MRTKAITPTTLAVALAVAAPSATAQNCSNTSVGLTPLNDLGAGTYMGEQGGLYPGGSNLRPAGHEAAGLSQVAQIVPRDAAGDPDPAGRIVFVSIGMSNATQEFSTFVTLATSDPLRAPAVQAVDCAQGGVAAEDMDDPSDHYWTTTVPGRLSAAGVTAAQVQAVWLKNANRMPTDPFPTDSLNLKANLLDVLHIIQDTFPNAKVCYVASRIYAGYATTALNPEPYAYEQSFTMKWLIEDQIDGDPTLNYDPDAGPVEAPWLSWGTYNWADGLVPRSDGLIWECSDFQADGTHPSTSGRLKVAEALLDFLHADTSASWYRGAGDPTPHFCDASDGALASCPCSNPGAPTSGCDLAQGTGGVALRVLAQQTAPQNRATLEGAGFPVSSAPTAVVIRSQSRLAAPVVFGDGLRCLGAPVVRLAASFASGGTSLHAFGHSPMSGAGSFHYQLWFRNAPPSFCTPDAFNLSNGRTLEW
jgi:hypothetical protein